MTLVDKIRRNRFVLREKAVARACNRVSSYRDRHWNAMVARRRGNGLRTFWWTGERNFGDLITPFLLRHFGITPILAGAPGAELAAAGSILGMLGVEFSGVILGAGLMADNWRLSFPRARILAVRGALTRERIGAPLDTPLGDPGLLVTDVHTRRRPKRYRLGLVPHYEDLGDPRLRSMARRHPNEMRIINVLRGPAAVIREIDECEAVLSSSLHGCVVADALGIPNRWVVFSDLVLGKGFKFRDYYSALEVERNPVLVSEQDDPHALSKEVLAPPLRTIGRLQNGLRAQFASLARLHGS